MLNYVINLCALPLAKKAISNPEDAFKSIVVRIKNFVDCLESRNFFFYLNNFNKIGSN
jgi:hypothetical protein